MPPVLATKVAVTVSMPGVSLPLLHLQPLGGDEVPRSEDYTLRPSSGTSRERRSITWLSRFPRRRRATGGPSGRWGCLMRTTSGESAWQLGGAEMARWVVPNAGGTGSSFRCQR